MDWLDLSNDYPRFRLCIIGVIARDDGSSSNLPLRVRLAHLTREQCVERHGEAVALLSVAAETWDIPSTALHEYQEATQDYERSNALKAARVLVNRLLAKAKAEMVKARLRGTIQPRSQPPAAQGTIITGPELAGGMTGNSADSVIPISPGSAPLDDTHLSILKFLFNSTTPKQHKEILREVKVSRGTLSKRLDDLRSHGFIQRPEGKRLGESITGAGRAEYLRHATPAAH
ncbi:MAG TPA: hypothetical protein VG269_07470 [Tepidisphaeraceae bacterium]|nr:hypothetical protein [Tepidisphaeraceae bacterium]